MQKENVVSARLIDVEGDRLVYLGARATPELWDSLWAMDKETVQKSLAASRDGGQLVALTKRYCKPEDGIILEGGCGRGQYVAALHRAGYECVGIDFAPMAVNALNEHAPELDIRLGDLRALPFSDASVAGYWSLGVIEHFWDGYHPLASEMSRVIKDGGYLFCAFPYMSPLRKIKAWLGCYPISRFKSEPADFYQFALSEKSVIETMAQFGFIFQKSWSSAGLKGIQGECGYLSTIFERLYSYEGRSLFLRSLRRMIDFGLVHVGTSHSVLCVFRRCQREI